MRTHYAPAKMAKLLGVSVATLQRWDREGVLKAFRTPTNRRYYTHEQYLQYIGASAKKGEGRTVAYVRVARRRRSADVALQKERIEEYCVSRGWRIDDWICDYGSGLNWERTGFTELILSIERGEVGHLILAHEDRLVREGFLWFRSFCERHGAQLIALNDERFSPEEELVEDTIQFLKQASERLHHLRECKRILHEVALRELHTGLAQSRMQRLPSREDHEAEHKSFAQEGGEKTHSLTDHYDDDFHVPSLPSPWGQRSGWEKSGRAPERKKTEE